MNFSANFSANFLKSTQAKSQQRHYQGGFTLLELLLATAILGGLMVVSVSLTSNFSEQERAQVAGKQLEQIVDTLEEYVQTTQPPQTGANDVLAVWTDLKATLEQNGGGTTTKLGGQFKIAERVVGGMRTFVVYTTQSAKFSMITKAARAAGGHAGYAGTQRGAFEAQSAYNMWGDNQANINAAFAGLIAPPADNTQGFLVALLRMPANTLQGPYLYRSGDESLRTMGQPLIMANNNIEGVDNINMQTLTVATSAEMRGKLEVLGTSNFVGDVTANGDIAANKNLSVTEDATIGGTLAATGDLSAANMTASIVKANNSLVTPLVNANNVDIAGNVTTKTVTATSNIDVSGNFSTENFVANGFTSTNEVNTNDLNVTQQISVDQGLTVSGNTQLNGNVQIDDCLQLNGDNYGGSGC